MRKANVRNEKSENGQAGWRLFLALCLRAKDDKILSELFSLLLTPEEMESLQSRCLIVRELLKQKKSQREIAKALNVSIAKITRGSNELKRITPQLRAYLKNHI